MDVEIVLDQTDGPGVREADMGQILQDLSVVHRDVAIGEALAFERCKHHEEFGGAVGLVLVIATGSTSLFYRDWHARLGEELL